MRLKYGLVIVAAAALAANALASGWNVTIMTSQGVLNPDGVVVNVPATIVPNPLPSITFNTNQSSPPITVGDGTNFTNGTFTGIYTVQDTSGTKAPLTGFTFVVGGFVWDFGQIIAFKKVIDLDTGQVLFTGSWVWSGAAYPGGANGAINFNRSTRWRTFKPLHGVRGVPASHRWSASTGHFHGVPATGGAGLGAGAGEPAGAGRRTGGACAATPQEVSIVPLSGYEMARRTPRHLFYCRRIASKSWRVGSEGVASNSSARACWQRA
jgi:hypothetical protein